MKNKKWLKVLAALAMGGVMAVSTFGMVACGGGNDDDDDKKTELPGDDDTDTDTDSDSDDDDDKVGPALAEGKVDVVYEFDAANFETKTYEEGWTDGIFSLAAKTIIRGRVKTSGIYDEDTKTDIQYETKNSVQLGDNDSALSITISAPGTLTFYVLNGSSGAKPTQGLAISKPNGSKLKNTLNYPANGNDSNIQLITLELDKAGKYTIKRASGTSDIFYAKFTQTVDNTAIESISLASKGKVDYIVGQELDVSNLAVTTIHKTTGRIAPVDSKYLVIDSSKYDATKSGTYEIEVSYTVAGNLDSDTTSFSTTYNVNVYDYVGLELGFNKIVKEKNNTTAGNGVYANHAVKQFYFKDAPFSADGLSIKAIGKLGDDEKIFDIKESEAEVTASTATVGKQTATVSYTANGTEKSEEFTIYVAEKPADIATVDTINLKVDKNTEDSAVGTANSGVYQFKTVQQAMDFINASGAKAAAVKTVNIAAGDYWERIEVTAPNVTFVGAGEDNTKIEYDSLYGETDAGGFTHTTDSTATLNIRESAVGFKMYNLTVSNYYNTLESYSTAKSNDKRALAMLIQADKVIIKDCTLLGFQDTLELFTGRQIFIGCTIKGSTDYIFGTNNTTYFYQCEINTVLNGDKGGYCTAFKGNNKGTDTDKVTYGAIFDECDFTAETGVPKEAGSLGRAWGVDAAVMIMNSNIGAHISLSESIDTPGRYISMGNGDPKDAQFKEYNNDGAGKIDTSLATVTLLKDAAEAANYNNFSVIFGKTNGKVTYSDAWNIVLADLLND